MLLSRKARTEREFSHQLLEDCYTMTVAQRSTKLYSLKLIKDLILNHLFFLFRER